MKSHANSLLILAQGILRDVQAAYPEYGGVDRDFERLTQLVKDRGLGVFTLDLPARHETLVRALESGRLDPVGTVRYSKEYPVPRLYAGLYMRIFNKDLCLKPDLDVNALAFLIQLLTVGKKTEVPCSTRRLYKAVEDFHDIERELREPSLRWSHDVLDPDGRSDALHLHDLLVDDLPLFPTSVGDRGEIRDLLGRCQQVADLVIERFPQFDPYSYSEDRVDAGRSYGFKHGPGAVAERSGRGFDKNQFLNWSAKLDYLFPFTLFGAMPNDKRDPPRNHEVAARLIAVPKTAKGPRLIAAEPSEHQYAQQLMLAWFEDQFDNVFGRYFISLKNQGASRDLVVQSSRDKSLATVDLSSASDRLTCYVVERMFRRNPSMLHSLHACRTRYVKDSILPRTSWVKLKKYASQGTATTFPVQSLIFLICAISVSIDGPVSWSAIRKVRRKVRVYGDDIIVPAHGYASLVDLLTTLQLKVNTNKSFVSGYFRESCGMDAYKGYDITPVKPKTTIPEGPTARKAVLDTYNNLFYKGYWHASDSLGSTYGGDFLTRIAVMGRAAGASARGCFSFNRTVADEFIERLPSGLRGISQRSRWRPPFAPKGIRFNHQLHRFEVRTYSLRNRSQIQPRDCGYSGMLQFSVAERHSGGIDTPPRLSGIPERPRASDGMRWEPLDNFFV